MSHRSRLALGLAGGYLLGRYRKTRWLLAVAALVASKRLGEAALQRGGGEGGSSPELKKLADQGRDTAASLLANQLRGLTSRIHHTTESLQQTSEGSAEETESESTEQSGEQSGESAESSAQAAGESGEESAGEEASEGEEATEQPNGQADSEEPAESASSSNSTGSAKGRKPTRRSGGSRGGGAASGERAQVSGRPDGLGAARRRR